MAMQEAIAPGLLLKTDVNLNNGDVRHPAPSQTKPLQNPAKILPSAPPAPPAAAEETTPARLDTEKTELLAAEKPVAAPPAQQCIKAVQRNGDLTKNGLAAREPLLEEKVSVNKASQVPVRRLIINLDDKNKFTDEVTV